MMLDLVNDARRDAGLSEVVMGDNRAAQVHADNALANCFSSHWGIDGLKPYMRYSLAGGYQANGENASGSDYCIRKSDGYRTLWGMPREIQRIMSGLMSSPGHRANILNPNHKKVNIGLAWDSYNIAAIQHFEGDYVEYDSLPAIEGGRITIGGRTKNGARLGHEDSVSVMILYDPPPKPLTRGQVSRTYCYSNGRSVAYLRKPLVGNRHYPDDESILTHQPCPDPYEVPPDADAPTSADEAREYWQKAYTLSQSQSDIPIVMDAVTAATWEVAGDDFSITADLRDVLSVHGPGVYTVMLWGDLGGEPEVISEYSIFHDVPTPPGYKHER